jgi:hypothetical protein
MVQQKYLPELSACIFVEQPGICLDLTANHPAYVSQFPELSV